MALRVAGLLRALETGLGRPKGGAPNPLFAQYVQGLEHRAAGADPVYPPCLLPPFPHPSAKTLAEPFAGVSPGHSCGVAGCGDRLGVFGQRRAPLQGPPPPSIPPLALTPAHAAV